MKELFALGGVLLVIILALLIPWIIYKMLVRKFDRREAEIYMKEFLERLN
jgi:uncharacterized membrane protein YqiK